MKTLHRLLMLVALLGATTSAGPAAATEAEDALKTAFTTYCATLGQPQPEICTSSPSLARQYLALEAVCPAGNKETYCVEFRAAAEKDGKETLAPLVLALDHETGRWSTRNRLAGATEQRIKLDVAGEPTVSLAKQEQITVVVEKTNPLLYGAVAGKPTEENVPELANIQKLLAVLGGNISALLTVAGTSDVARAASGDPLGDFVRKIESESLTPLREALLQVECRTGQTVAQTSDAITFIQSIELGKSDEYRLEPPTPPGCTKITRLTASAVAAAFDNLQDKLFTPQDRPEDCAALLDYALAVINVDPTKPDQAHAAFLKLDTAPVGSCKQFADLKQEIDRIFKNVRKTLNAGQQEELRKALEKVKADKDDEKLLEASTLVKRLVPIRKDAEGILAKRDDVHKAAGQVEVFERRLDRYRLRKLELCGTAPGIDCVKTTSLDVRLVLEPQLKDVNPTKIQKHSVTVKPDSQFASKVVATRPAEVKADYRLDSVLRGLWGISASAIYTDLASPTFGAVASEADPMKKVIAITDETTRAGDIALLADFRLGQWLACRNANDGCGSRARWFGVEFGAGVSDDPAFYAGISLRPSRSWRLGFGYTYQQVKELRQGQVLGMGIDSADDIKTRDDFAGDWYISLSFALDSLTLFASGD